MQRTSEKDGTREKKEGGKSDLFVLESCTYVGELLIDTQALLLFILTVSDVADEDREPSHT